MKKEPISQFLFGEEKMNWNWRFVFEYNIVIFKNYVKLERVKL